MALYKLEPDPMPAAPAARKKPGELGLDLSASMLRLPYPPATRLVLAEIISLHQCSTRGCDASDSHFADRLTISINTASRAVQQLFEAKLITKTVDKAAGFYRVLVPRLESIEATAKLNPYPQNGATPTPKMGVAYPQNDGSPTPKTGVALPPKWGTNTSVNLSPNSSLTPQSLSAPLAALGEGEEQKKIEHENPDNQQVTTGHDSEALRITAPAKTERAENVANSSETISGGKSAAPKKSRAARVAVVPASKAGPLPDSCPLAELLNEVGDAARVQLVDEPLTEKQATALLNEFSEPVLRDILCQMANWKLLLTKCHSVNLTARNWLRKRGDVAKKSQSDESAHNHQTERPTGRNGFNRSTNGAKPTADAGQFARALAERRGQ